MTLPITAGAAPAVPNPGEEIRQPIEQGATDIESSLPKQIVTKRAISVTKSW